MKKILLVSSLIFLTACVSVPKKLEVSENTNLVDFTNSKEQISQVVGQKARWGGVIAEIKNNPDNTMIEVVNFKLSSGLRPITGDETLGRFRVYVDGLLDPIIYKKGRSVTSLGNIAELEKGKIGDQNYSFPVLKNAGVHLWEKTEQVDVTLIRQPFWRYQDPFFGIHSRFNYHRPIMIRAVKTKKQSTQKKEPSSKKKKN